MSLPFFHVLFISLSTLLLLGLGFFSAAAWRADGDGMWLALAILGFAGGAGLVVYANRFLQKVRALAVTLLCVAGTLAWPADALACPACVGTSSSVQQSGMNLGILTLLGVTAFMLTCFAAFMVYLARRASIAEQAQSFEPTQSFMDLAPPQASQEGSF